MCGNLRLLAWPTRARLDASGMLDSAEPPSVTSAIEEDRAMHMAPGVKAWTVDDLAHMPDDGQRYEVIDGELFVTPSPALRHQDAIAELVHLLRPYVVGQAIGHLVFAPADVTFSPRRGVQPDLFVAPLVD